MHKGAAGQLRLPGVEEPLAELSAHAINPLVLAHRQQPFLFARHRLKYASDEPKYVGRLVSTIVIDAEGATLAATGLAEVIVKVRNVLVMRATADFTERGGRHFVTSDFGSLSFCLLIQILSFSTPSL